jgi:class 3 adenylate cyclase
LRGFTAWSRERNADDIQGIIELLESSFQDAFSRRWCQRLFVKSTGDGFMLVSEAGWYAAGGETLPSGFQNGHVRAFCRDCAQTISLARGRLPKELAVGCGITAGAVNQLYLLGRVDYLGAIINEASKIQSLAYDELCISDATSKYLEAEGFVLSGKAVHGKGIRCDPDALSSA